MKCKKCQSESLIMRPNAKNPSATELICAACGTWQKFIGKEEIRLFEIRHQKQVPAPTNADRIRSMSDEDLATEITKNPSIPCRMCEYYNHKLGHCDARRDFACVTAYAEALALDWLKQPVKEELI